MTKRYSTLEEAENHFTVKVPEKFVTRVKRAFPDISQLHEAAEIGSPWLLRYLEDIGDTTPAEKQRQDPRITWLEAEAARGLRNEFGAMHDHQVAEIRRQYQPHSSKVKEGNRGRNKEENGAPSAYHGRSRR